MKILPFIVFLLCGLKATTAAYKIVCYYESWAVYFKNNGAVKPEDIDVKMCTHLNYAFVNYNSDGNLKIDDQNLDIDQKGYTKVTGLKKKNKKLKVMLSIGGASASAATFSSIAKSSTKRKTMIESARSFMTKYKFDGVDIDWETPGSGDKENFVKLLEEFRKDFDKNGWLVTAAVTAIPGDGYDVRKISNTLDFINVMSYDMYGSWSKYTGQNAPLYASSVESDWEKQNLNMDASIKAWIKAGAKKEKLIAGIAFYGRTFTLKTKSKKGLHAPIKGPGKAGSVIGSKGLLSYLEVCKKRNSWNCKYDSEQKNPYCVDGDQWLGYDNPSSVRSKVSYIKKKKLGGAMIWSIDQDDIKGNCGDKSPLLHAIYDNLK